MTLQANCLLIRQFAWSVKSYFLGKIRKISCLSSSEIAHSMVNVRQVQQKWNKTLCRAICLAPKCLCLPSEKWSTLKGNNFLPFSFRVRPFSEGAKYVRKQNENHKSCCPCKRWQKIYQMYPVPFRLTHFILNRLPNTIYWKSPLLILGMSGYEI